MAVLRITVGTLDKASANEVYKLAKGIAERISTEEDRYSRVCLQGGKEGTPDPHHGEKVYIVRITAGMGAIGAVLEAFDRHLASEWNRGAKTAVSGTGRVWWAT